MGARMKIDISVEAYAAAKQVAEKDRVPVDALIESLVNRHVADIAAMEAYADMPRFSLDSYEMIRDPGETEEDYQARLSLV